MKLSMASLELRNKIHAPGSLFNMCGGSKFIRELPLGEKLKVAVHIAEESGNERALQCLHRQIGEIVRTDYLPPLWLAPNLGTVIPALKAHKVAGHGQELTDGVTNVVVDLLHAGYMGYTIKFVRYFGQTDIANSLLAIDAIRKMPFKTRVMNFLFTQPPFVRPRPVKVNVPGPSDPEHNPDVSTDLPPDILKG